MHSTRTTAATPKVVLHVTRSSANRAMYKTLLLISVILIVTGLLLSPLAWVLRDGLGPSAETSGGLEAAYRMFMTYYWGPAVTAGSLLLVACKLSQRNNDMGTDK
jgi:hypothetical protein